MTAGPQPASISSLLTDAKQNPRDSDSSEVNAASADVGSAQGCEPARTKHERIPAKAHSFLGQQQGLECGLSKGGGVVGGGNRVGSSRIFYSKVQFITELESLKTGD